MDKGTCGLQSMVCKESDMTKQLTHTHTHDSEDNTEDKMTYRMWKNICTSDMYT